MVHNRYRPLAVVAFLILVSFQLQGVALSQSIPFETIDQGETSYFNYGDPNFLGADMVITDQQTWTWFWGQHTFSLSPTPPIPNINFNNEMVLVTMLGFQTSGGGPSIEISSIEGIVQSSAGSGSAKTGQGLSKGIQVFIKENREPGTNQVITNPYHVVKTKRFISLSSSINPLATPAMEIRIACQMVS